MEKWHVPALLKGLAWQSQWNEHSYIRRQGEPMFTYDKRKKNLITMTSLLIGCQLKWTETWNKILFAGETWASMLDAKLPPALDEYVFIYYSSAACTSASVNINIHYSRDQLSTHIKHKELKGTHKKHFTIDKDNGMGIHYTIFMFTAGDQTRTLCNSSSTTEPYQLPHTLIEI